MSEWDQFQAGFYDGFSRLRMKGLQDMSSTLETTDAGATAGEIESGAEMVIDVAGIVETPASLDEIGRASCRERVYVLV